MNDVPVFINPNPTSDFIQLQTNANVTSLTISDIAGRKIKQFLTASNKEIIDVRDFNSGIYVITITTENQKQFHQNIVIQ